MDYRLLGGAGLKVPVLGFGTATFGGGNEDFRVWGNTQLAEATRIVDVAIDAGAVLFDTADNYSDGLSEEIVGKAVAGRRDQVLIATKATSRIGKGPNDLGSSRHHLIAACEGSLKRLKTDYIDLYQMHAFDAQTPVEETLKALDDLIRAGKIRYVGCSNFSGWHVMKSLAASDRFGLPRYVAHQVLYSLIAREYEWELMPLALDQKLGALVWSPLGGAILTGKITRNRKASVDSRYAVQGSYGPAFPEDHLYRIIDELANIAEETGRTIPQVALNWVLHRPSVATIIIGARNEAQLRDNLGAIEFRLSREQVIRLDKVSAKPMIYPYWHQQDAFSERNPPAVS